jgi:hypothetical protein
MRRIGLVVEGAYDKAVLPILVRKLRPVEVSARQCRGPLKGKFRGILDEFERAGGVDTALVVCDADGNAPVRLEDDMRALIAGRSYAFALGFIVVVQALEAWLLADESAVRAVAGVARRISNPERIRDPKSEIKRILAKCGKPYTPRVACEIANLAHVSVMKKRCPSFDRFQAFIV